jgi:hypothetical protein
MIATGRSDEAMAKAIDVARGRIAFYGCTVAYKPVLDIHDWGDLQDELIARTGFGAPDLSDDDLGNLLARLRD